MTTQIASADSFLFRKTVGFNLFRWNLRLGVALAPREESFFRRRRRPPRPPDVPNWLREDIGLSPLPERNQWWEYR